MTNIQFTSESLLDIEEIVVWYENQREGLSHDFELCLEAGINEISRMPSAFQKKYRNVKILFIQRFPYGIHYITTAHSVIIVGIFHTSRSPKSWTGRI